jgi:hypothetical protein
MSVATLNRVTVEGHVSPGFEQVRKRLPRISSADMNWAAHPSPSPTSGISRAGCSGDGLREPGVWSQRNETPVAHGQREWFAERFREWTTAAGVKDPKATGRALVVLFDGAVAGSEVDGPERARDARLMAKRLLAG